MHVSNLFPKNKSNVTNGIHACFQLSFLIFAAFQLLYNYNPMVFTANRMFLVYSALVFLSLIAGLFWPGRAYRPGHHGHVDDDGKQKGQSPSIILPPGGFKRESSSSISKALLHARKHKTITEATFDAEDGENENAIDQEFFDDEDLVIVNTAGVMNT